MDKHGGNIKHVLPRDAIHRHTNWMVSDGADMTYPDLVNTFVGGLISEV